MMARVAVYTDRKMIEHQTGVGHPESPDRLKTLIAMVEGHPSVDCYPITPATSQQIEAVHARDYVRMVLDLWGHRARLDEDTLLSESSVEAALLAAGAGICAVTYGLSRDRGKAVALVRPPGHHAERDRAMGFCIFNNIAVAAQYARTEQCVDRVLIVDWDVHHGNGTQHIFEHRSDVFVLNVHQGGGFYPGTGDASEMGLGDGKGFTLNVPVSASITEDEYIELFQDKVFSVVHSFQPDLILVSAGFDAHVRDPLGQLPLTAKGYGKLCQILCNASEAYGLGRLVLFLEGGYDLSALSESLSACIDVLAKH